MRIKNIDEIKNAVSAIIEEGHMAEVKVENGQVLVVDVYSKRKVIRKQTIDENEAK